MFYQQGVACYCCCSFIDKLRVIRNEEFRCQSNCYRSVMWFSRFSWWSRDHCETTVIETTYLPSHVANSFNKFVAFKDTEPKRKRFTDNRLVEPIMTNSVNGV